MIGHVQHAASQSQTPGCTADRKRIDALALRYIKAYWRRAAHNGKTAMNPFEILCEDRFTEGVAQYDDRLSQRAGRYVASAVRGRGKVSHRLTH